MHKIVLKENTFYDEYGTRCYEHKVWPHTAQIFNLETMQCTVTVHMDNSIFLKKVEMEEIQVLSLVFQNGRRYQNVFDSFFTVVVQLSLFFSLTVKI